MRSRAVISSFGLAFALAGGMACCSPRLALASEDDVSPVLERLEVLTSYEVSEESLIHDVSLDTLEMKQELSEVRTLQDQQLQDVQGLRAELADSYLTVEEHEGLKRLSSIDDTLQEIKKAVVPEEEKEEEVKASREVEGEGETVPTVEPATLDDIARLLMINTATLAILLGVEVWRPLYDVLAGVK